MGTEIENSVGVNHGKDRSHVDALMAAGGFARPNRDQGSPASRDDGVSMARPAGVKGAGGPAPAVRTEAAPLAKPLREVEAGQLKRIRPLNEGKLTRKLKRSPVPPTPRVAWVRLDQLMIDDSYQRALSSQSMALIRRMVENWDWARFKPLSVAAMPDGLYEVVDGQHTAIAAATHGSIEALPCLVLHLVTQAERAQAFVGVNTERTALRSYALFRGRLVAGEALAVAVQGAVADAGARLVGTIAQTMTYAPGDVACISTLRTLAKAHGRTGLARLLRICVEAGVGPAPSALLRALEGVALTGGGSPDPVSAEDLDVELASAIRRVGLERLISRGDDYTATGLTRRSGLIRVLNVELGRVEA